MILSPESDYMRQQHADASKSHRVTNQEMHEAVDAAEHAKSLLYEYLSSKVGLQNDAGFIKLRNSAMAAVFKQNDLTEEYRAAQVKTEKHLQTELKFLHTAIASLQAKLGVTTFSIDGMDDAAAATGTESAPQAAAAGS